MTDALAKETMAELLTSKVHASHESSRSLPYCAKHLVAHSCSPLHRPRHVTPWIKDHAATSWRGQRSEPTASANRVERSQEYWKYSAASQCRLHQITQLFPGTRNCDGARLMRMLEERLAPATTVVNGQNRKMQRGGPKQSLLVRNCSEVIS